MKKKKQPKHVGFANAAESIARRQNISVDRADAILASGARHASPAARRANPRLARVSGVKKKNPPMNPKGPWKNC